MNAHFLLRALKLSVAYVKEVSIVRNIPLQTILVLRAQESWAENQDDLVKCFDDSSRGQ